MTAHAIFNSEAGEQAIMRLYDEALATWPVAHETRSVATRHGDTFVIASGDPAAPPLFLLHGAGINSAMWGADVATYSRHHRVYAADLPGEPGKSAHNRPPWQGAAFAEWLEDLFAALSVGQATLIGLSQGAWTALRFATIHPDKVDRLVLITPGGVIPDKLSFVLRVIPLMMLGDSGIRRLVRTLFASQPVPDGVEAITMTMMKHFKARTGMLPLFSDEELRRLTMPVLLIGGDEDALRDNRRIAARLDALLPNLTVEIIAGGGHALLHTVGIVEAFVRG